MNMGTISRWRIGAAVLAMVLSGGGLVFGQDEGEGQDPEAVTSLLGRELTPAAIDPERKKELEAKLIEAQNALIENPGDEDAIIWVGRRLAYLGRYREAIAAFTAGLEQHPDSAKLLRHRGHRYITVRELDKAVNDLTQAASLIRGTLDEVEPDGMPNAAGVPTSSLHTNIYYHLGLAQYLKGDFRASRRSYDLCRAAAGNDDMKVAASYWLYLNNRRLLDSSGAAKVLAGIRPGMEVIENHTYHRLLLLYMGVLKPEDVPGAEPSAVGAAVDDATMAYGIAMWHEFNLRPDEAKQRKERIVNAEGGAWAAFGFIAAEADLARENSGPVFIDYE